ncbi:MAG: MFS transporter [Candidatus Bathyarchaeia archaeon]|nr:MFS transporter [Candidatus Bathyarchaeota archaeon]
MIVARKSGGGSTRRTVSLLRTYPKAYFELLASSLTLIMGMSLASSFLPIYAHELDPSGLMIGFVSSAWFLSRIFTEIPSGILADRIGRYKLLVSGLALSSIGALLCSTSINIYMLIAGRGLWGLGTGLYFMSSSAIIFDTFHQSVRGTALGTFQSIEFIGSFIGAPLGGFMSRYIGYRGVFLSSAILTSTSFMIASKSRDLKHNEGYERYRIHLDISSIRRVLPGVGSWSLTAVYINSLTRMLTWNGVSGTVLPLYLNMDLGIDVELIGVVMAIRTLGIITSTGISGWLSDKLGRKPMITIGLLLEAAGLYGYTIGSTYLAIVSIAFIEGFGRGMILTSLMVLLSEIAPPDLRGSALGIYRTFMGLGGFIGPIIFTPIYEGYGYCPAALSAVAVILASLAIISTVKPSRSHTIAN